MSIEIALVLGLLGLVILLFATETLPPDLSAVLALSVLLITGVLSFENLLARLPYDVIVLLVGIFVISAALERTGLTEAAGRSAYRIVGERPRAALLGLTSAVAVFSAWMNNTAVTPIFIPPAIGIARRFRMSPSKFLMPVAYASMLGGTCTLIGTSTNIASSGMLQAYGLPGLGMFELAPIGLVMAVLGLAYLTVASIRFLPPRVPMTVEEEYPLREYLSEIVVMSESPLAGMTLAESGIGRTLGLAVLAIHREDGTRFISPTSEMVLREGDLLIVQGEVPEIARVKAWRGLKMRADLHPSAADLTSDTVNLVEVMPTPTSDLIGRTLKEVNFRGRYGVTAMGLYRAGAVLMAKVGQVRMRLGDVLLVQGRKESIERLSHLPELEVLEDMTRYIFRRRKGFMTLGVFAAGIAAGSTGLIPLPLAIIISAVLVTLTRCLPWEDLYRVIYWRLLVLIAAMMAFSTAMHETGTDRFLSDMLTGYIGSVPALGMWHAVPVLAGFFALTAVLTQSMSNASAALVVLPVAISAAETLGLNPRSFAVTVALAASCSFITPLEPSCLLVYGPGRYRFRDYMLFGTPLTIVAMIVTLVLVPVIWPL